MEENYFVWDEFNDELAIHGAEKVDDDTTKKKRGQSQIVQTSNVYCPHGHLILTFHESLNTSEKIKFRKRYLRKVPPGEPNVVILQDVKNLVLYLLATPVSPQFINFFHLPAVDRFLRALLVYFHRYVEIWENLMEERAATMKKAANPLAQGNRLRYANELRVLRAVLGKEYGNLVLGLHGTDRYHHLMAGSKKGSTLTQSQGEKDLRIFEILINVAHRLVWIALKRKNFSVIEMELHRLFRTDAYNMAERRNGDVRDMLENDILVLHGPKVRFKRKLLQNSPLVRELMRSGDDSRVSPSDVPDTEPKDPCIAYLKNALTAEEDKLPELGVRMGILGQSRLDYDITLTPCEKKYSVQSDENGSAESEKRGRMMSAVSDRKPFKETTKEKIDADVRLSQFGTDTRLLNLFLQQVFDGAMPKGYQKAREESRRKWFVREQKRQGSKQLGAHSIETNISTVTIGQARATRAV